MNYQHFFLLKIIASFLDVNITHEHQGFAVAKVPVNAAEVLIVLCDPIQRFSRLRSDS